LYVVALEVVSNVIAYLFWGRLHKNQFRS
jgi:hypothetical protein